MSLKRCVLRYDLNSESQCLGFLMGERDSKLGGEAAGGSGPHGDQVSKRCTKMDGGRGPERADGCADVQEFS